jgi:peptidoglycan/xylan/chitin deacetylase (PgdA/CDA1 family)
VRAVETRQLLGLALAAATACTSLVLADPAPAGMHAAPRLTPDRRPVPILMYHVIADPPSSAPFPELYVSRAELRAQVRWLAHAGYEAVTLGRVFDAWHGRATLPQRPVVLSFDDGYRSHLTAALPILAARRWPGVLNLDLSNLSPPWGIGVAGVRKLIAAEWEIDAHSLTHADLPSLSGAALAREVSGSRQEIRRMFGVAPRFFCYPAGRYDAEAVAAVAAAGFEGATTTEPGLARPANPFTLARVRVSRGDGAAGLARKLAALGGPRFAPQPR